MKGFRSVGISCFVWAFTGGMLALACAHEFDLGPFRSAITVAGTALIAGFIAWATYDVRGLVSALKYSAAHTIAWRPTKEGCKSAGAGALYGLAMWPTVSLILFFVARIEVAHAVLTSKEMIICWTAFTLPLLVAGCAFFMRKDDADNRAFAIKLAKWCNPVGIFIGSIILLIWCVYQTPRGLETLGRTIRTIGRFCRLTYIQVSCEERRARSLGTTLGVLFGCSVCSLYGIPLPYGGAICGAIGFLIGMVSYNYASKRTIELQRI